MKLLWKKHSPGPWRAEAGGYVGWKFDGGYNGVITDAVGLNVYAGPSSFKSLCGRTAEQAEANATIMAGAPQMYEALRRIHEYASTAVSTRQNQQQILERISLLALGAIEKMEE